jgi:hypothetical protein
VADMLGGDRESSFSFASPSSWLSFLSESTDVKGETGDPAMIGDVLVVTVDPLSLLGAGLFELD